jgi:hypothetical protein
MHAYFVSDFQGDLTKTMLTQHDLLKTTHTMSIIIRSVLKRTLIRKQLRKTEPPCKPHGNHVASYRNLFDSYLEQIYIVRRELGLSAIRTSLSNTGTVLTVTHDTIVRYNKSSSDCRDSFASFRNSLETG